MDIEYETKDSEAGCRKIQPVCIYAHNGHWYCTAYCFLREGFRVFRCDRIRSASEDMSGMEKRDLGEIRLSRKEVVRPEDPIRLQVELTRVGVQRCEAELWLAPMLRVQEDGSGILDAEVSRGDLSFYTDFLIGLGHEAALKGPEELREAVRDRLTGLIGRYS